LISSLDNGRERGSRFNTTPNYLGRVKRFDFYVRRFSRPERSEMHKRNNTEPHDQWNFEGGPVRSSAKGRFAIVAAALVILTLLLPPQVL